MSSVWTEAFGLTAGGAAVERFTLRNAQGMTAKIITFGATVTELWAPDRDGNLDDVVLGFDHLAPYETQSPYFGCTVGRVAFRIAGARFLLDGKEHRLTRNAGAHHLHGGAQGFSHVVWKAEPLRTGEATAAVRLTHRSPDGDQGYPGNLDASVTFTLTDQNALRIDYQATSDRATPVNLTNHSYFNLGGAASGDVLGHVLRLAADRYTPTDQAMTPTGQIVPVHGTPFDFSRPTAIGARIGQTAAAAGYDLSYLLNQPGDLSACAATVVEPTRGRVMEVYTTQPAIILYTGNALDGTLQGKQGARYGKHAGLCLETGHLPDSVHHPHFPSVILRPGQTYRHTCVYRFTAAARSARSSRPRD